MSWIPLFLVATLACANARMLVDEHQQGFEAEKTFQEDIVNEWRVKPKSVKDIPGLSDEMLTEAIKEAKKETEEQEKKTKRMPKPLDNHAGIPIEMSHYKRFLPELEPSRIDAMVMERTTKKLAEKMGLSHQEAAKKLLGLQKRTGLAICPSVNMPADPQNNGPSSIYRTIDGKGNNLNRPEFGRAMTAFIRLIPSSYADGISQPRVAKNGDDLPNARLLSSKLFKEKNRPSNRFSHMAMVWGQFIDHDINHGAQPDISCSSPCVFSGECVSIRIPAQDQPFSGKTCMQLKRDVPRCNSHGVIKPRDQINIKSSFVDASQIYGDDPVRFVSLRNGNTAFLRVRANPDGNQFKTLLPKQVKGFCRTPDVNTMPCFRAGDFRTNENPGLSSLHTIWTREHNRIASELKKRNSNWSEDKLFFEARKIVGAMVQHITYNEFLPLILSKRTRKRFRLILSKNKFFYGYSPFVDPTIMNAFAAAAYRFAHSMIQNQLSRVNKNNKNVEPPIPMNQFENPTFLYQNKQNGIYSSIDAILRGLTKDRSQIVDGFFSKAVQEQLVRGPNDLADLPALNIQRGREHGIPGYNHYRAAVGLKKATGTDFKGFRHGRRSGLISFANIRRLEKEYVHTDDVDLFAGGILEKAELGGIMGPTFARLIANQFARIRIGDRFWYENPGEFTKTQLTAIRKVTLAGIICENGDRVKKIQKFVLRRRSKRNARRLCSKIPIIDLSKWSPKVY